MDEQLRDHWLWSLALILVRDYDFDWIDNPLTAGQQIFTGPDGQVLDQCWLVRNEGRDYQLVRLQAVDGAWPSMVARDMRQFADHLPLFRRQLKARTLTVDNLYVFSSFYDETIKRYLEELNEVDDHKSKLRHHGVIVTQAVYGSGIEVDHFDISQLNVNTQEIEQEIVRYMTAFTLEETKLTFKKEKKKKQEAFQRIFHYGKPYFTFTFLIINMVMFYVLETVGSSTEPTTLIRFGAKWNPAIVEGEYWRLLTPMFLHIGWLHLAFNSLALYFLGGAVERIYGSLRFLFMYLFAGFTGTLASFAFTPNLAAGASGAIFGCFGALLYFGLKNRNLFFRTMGTDIIFIVILNLGMGFAVPMIDNFGHIGGLAGGFLASAMLNLPGKRHFRERALAFLISVASIPVLLLIGSQQALHSPETYLVQAELAMENEDYEEAQMYLQEAIDSGMDHPDVYGQLGSLYVHTEQYARAEETLELAIDKGGDRAELYFQLAYAQLQQEKFEQGRKNLQETIARNPQMMEAYYNLALVYWEEGMEAEALEVLARAEEVGIRDERLNELHEKIVTD